MFEWLLVIVFILALLGAGAWVFRSYILGDGNGGLFGAARERRIGLSETVMVDSRRKLMLIYRDGVEHLIMTGGPVDVVIEQNIQPQPAAQPRRHSYDQANLVAEPAAAAAAPAPAAAFGRIRQRAGGSSAAE